MIRGTDHGIPILDSFSYISIYFSDLRNFRRNFVEEIDSNGWTSTLSWIFNWKVPKVAHPSPMDVALNNYSQYASKGRVSNKSHRKHSSQHQQNINKWSRRKRKHLRKSQQSWRNHSQRRYQYPPQSQQLSFQQRSSSSSVVSKPQYSSQQTNINNNKQQPYVYEKPLSYYDASQVYFYPSHKAS